MRHASIISHLILSAVPNNQRGVIPQGNLFLILQKSRGKKSARFVNIDGTTSSSCKFLYHMRIQIFIKRCVGKQIVKILIVKSIWISNNFFSLSVKILVMFSLYCRISCSCCNGALLRRLNFMPLSINFWYHWQLIFRTISHLSSDLRMPGLHYRCVIQVLILSWVKRNCILRVIWRVPFDSAHSVIHKTLHLRSFSLPSLTWFLQEFFIKFHPQIWQNYGQRSTHG